MKKINFILALLIFFSACSTSEEEKNTDTEKTVNYEEFYSKTANLDANKIKAKLVNMRGGNYLKTVNIKGAAIEVIFVKDFQELKSIFPMLTSTEEDYKKDFQKSFTIDKILCDLPGKLFTKFKETELVEILLPFEGTNYSVKVSKQEFTEFCGKTIEEISTDYTANYANEFVYDEAGRNKFLAQFSTK